MAGNRDLSWQANVFAMSSPGASVDGLYAVIGRVQRGNVGTHFNASDRQSAGRPIAYQRTRSLRHLTG
jgi:hypothetical protein